MVEMVEKQNQLNFRTPDLGSKNKGLQRPIHKMKMQDEFPQNVPVF